MTGWVAIAGLGPGRDDMVTPEVTSVLAQATDIIGYIPYVARVAPREGLNLHPTDNRVELDRALHALQLAEGGARVVVVSSGDPGVFAMASAVFEAVEKHAEFAQTDIRAARRMRTRTPDHLCPRGQHAGSGVEHGHLGRGHARNGRHAHGGAGWQFSDHARRALCLHAPVCVLIQPSHNRGHVACRGADGQVRPVCHNHGQPQGARGVELRARTGAACVLGDNKGDRVFAQQALVAFLVEGSSGEEHRGVRQGQGCVRRIDQAQHIVVLWLGGKEVELLFANRQKHPCGRVRQRARQGLHIGHKRPVVTGLRYPSRTFKTDQCSARLSAGRRRVLAHAAGKGMGGVDHMGDPLCLQKRAQPRRTAKPTDPHRDRLGDRCICAARVGIEAVDTCLRQRARQLSGLGCTPQKKDAHDG